MSGNTREPSARPRSSPPPPPHLSLIPTEVLKGFIIELLRPVHTNRDTIIGTSAVNALLDGGTGRQGGAHRRVPQVHSGIFWCPHASGAPVGGPALRPPRWRPRARFPPHPATAAAGSSAYLRRARPPPLRQGPRRPTRSRRRVPAPAHSGSAGAASPGPASDVQSRAVSGAVAEHWLTPFMADINSIVLSTQLVARDALISGPADRSHHGAVEHCRSENRHRYHAGRPRSAGRSILPPNRAPLWGRRPMTSRVTEVRAGRPLQRDVDAAQRCDVGARSAPAIDRPGRTNGVGSRAPATLAIHRRSHAARRRPTIRPR